MGGQKVAEVEQRQIPSPLRMKLRHTTEWNILSNPLLLCQYPKLKNLRSPVAEIPSLPSVFRLNEYVVLWCRGCTSIKNNAKAVVSCFLIEPFGAQC
jgi:hypothetical protein